MYFLKSAVFNLGENKQTVVVLSNVYKMKLFKAFAPLKK